MGREACHTLPQILPCEAPSRREAPLPVPKARFTRKKELLSLRTKALFSCHVNPMDQFPSWWHKTVTQRSGHSFEVRSSGASSHFVPLHHDPATRSRCRSEETPRPAKRPRRKAEARAKRGVSELCFQNTLDQLKIQGADSLCIIHVTTQSEYNSSVPPKSPVERSEWI